MQRRVIDNTERDAIRQGWRNKCAYCTNKVGEDYHIDHIIPHSSGGACDLKNLCLSCADCNLRKSNKRLPLFYEGLLLSIASKRKQSIEENINKIKKELEEQKPKEKNNFIPKSYDVKAYYCTKRKTWVSIIEGDGYSWVYNPSSQINMKGIQEHGRKWRVQRRVNGVLRRWICSTLSVAVRKRDEVFNMKHEDFIGGADG